MNRLVLGESLEVLLDHRGKTPKKLGSDFTATGVPVASAIMVDKGVLDLSGARCVSRDMWKLWMPVATRAGDVLLTSEAPLGRVARVRTDAPLVLGQRLFALRGKPGILDNGFLYYALQTESVRADLLGRSTGTTVFGIRQSALRRVLIPAPMYEEQRTIAEVLGALDDKIAANDRLISTSRQLMVALASTSEAVRPLGEMATLDKRVVDPFTFGDRWVDHFSLPAFDTGLMPEVARATSIRSNKYLLDGPCVLVSKLNPRFPRAWDIVELGSGESLASTEFLVLKPMETSSSVLWAVLAQPDFGAGLESKVAGTSGSHQRVRPHDVMATEVLDTGSIVEGLRKQIEALGRVVFERRRESRLLSRARDTLLPLLMSGKIRVKDAEEAVQGVV